MTAAQVAARLAAQGLADAELPAVERLAARVAAASQSQITSHKSQMFWSWVPGRVEVLGKHTDYAGGHSLVAPLPRGFVFAAAARTDELVRLVDATDGSHVEIGPAGASPFAASWAGYAATVARRLACNFPSHRRGADIVFASNLPSAAGMSSSSALVTGAALSLALVRDLPDAPAWRLAMPSRWAIAAYFASIENGQDFGELAGDAGVGTEGGSEDHAAMLCGTAGAVTLFSFLPSDDGRGDFAWPADWALILAQCGVRAEKTGAARERYNAASRAVRALVGCWRRRHGGPARRLAEVLAAAPSHADELRGLVRLRPPDGWSSHVLLDRLDHFLREDARVAPAGAAIAAADAATLGALARESHEDADRLLGNQTPETNALARMAHEAGAFAASGFGAGFGGSVWAAAPREDAELVARRILERYRAEHPARHGDAFVVRAPGPAVQTWNA